MYDTDSDTTGGMSLNLTLSYQPIGLVRATLTELLDEYLAIDTGPVSLTDNSEVMVVFKSTNRSYLRFRARVISASSDRTLLQIWDNRQQTYTALQHALH